MSNKHWPIGQTIKKVRMLSPEELDAEGWDHPGVVLELGDGTIVYPSRDPEGNGPGVLFAIDPDGAPVHVAPHLVQV